MRWPYNPEEPIKSEYEGTYTDGGGDLPKTLTYEWVHPVSQILDALDAAGLEVDFLHEHYHVVFERWPMLVKTGPNRWDLPAQAPRVPLMLSLMARTPGP